MNIDEEIGNLVAALFDAKQRYSRLSYDEDDPQVLGAPSSPEQLAQLQRILGTTLPPSYAAFLRRHNGWANFNGEAKILSVEDHRSAWLRDRLEIVRTCIFDNPSNRPSPLERGCIPIYMGPTEPDFALFDPLLRRADGELTVLCFDYAQEVARHASFYDYLVAELGTTKSMLDTELSGREA
jgi:hypothetical protein